MMALSVQPYIRFCSILFLICYVDAFHQLARQTLSNAGRKSCVRARQLTGVAFRVGRYSDPVALWTGLASKRRSSDDQHKDDSDGATTDFLMEQWRKADPLEIRLDVTLACCFVIARCLVYDVATGIKTVPGYEVRDLIFLANTMSSALVLACCWTAVGLITGLFEESRNYFTSGRIALTALLAGPIWLLSEIFFHWPPGGADGAAEPLVTVLTGTVGLFAVMSICRLATAGWR